MNSNILGERISINKGRKLGEWNVYLRSEKLLLAYVEVVNRWGKQNEYTADRLGCNVEFELRVEVFGVNSFGKQCPLKAFEQRMDLLQAGYL